MAGNTDKSIYLSITRINMHWSTSKRWSQCYQRKFRVVTVPTCGLAIVDFMITTHPENIKFYALESIVDFRVLYCEFSSTNTVCEAKKKIIFDYSPAKSELISNEMSSFAIGWLFSFHLSGIEEKWRILRNKLTSFKHKYIPKVAFTSSIQNTWFTANGKRCIYSAYTQKRNSWGSDVTWKLHREHAELCENKIQIV